MNPNLLLITSVSKVKDRIEFSRIISEAYSVTDYICKDYPNHFEWYWSKTVPALFTGSREILVATVNSKIAGVSFLKKDSLEKKVCTFLILPEFRGLHIATILMEASFEFLETTTPLISLADYKLEMFKGLIQKYNWKQTQVLEGYYNKSSKLVFNRVIN